MRHVDYQNHYDIKNAVESICIRSENYFHNLKNAKILLTGGTGFFGFWLMNVFMYLFKENKFNGKIYLITRDRDGFIECNKHIFSSNFVDVIEGDIKSVKLDKIKPDHLIHFASTSASETYNNIKQIEKIDTLYLGTKNILEQCGNSLKKVLFASSGAAYGEIDTDYKITEDTFTRLMSNNEKFALCIGKTISEFQISFYSKVFNYDYSIARCFSFAGEFMPLSLHYAFGNFIRNAMQNENIVVTGSGEALRSYMYVGDAIVWFFAMLSNPKNDIFNVGSDNGISIKHLAEIIAKKSNCKVFAKPIKRNEGNFVRSSYIPSLSKIKEYYPELDCWTRLNKIIDICLKKNIN